MSRYALELTSAPAVEPLTIAEAKLHCKVDTSDENDLFTSWILAARKQCEEYLGQAFITQTWKMYLDEFPTGEDDAIRVPLSPLASVSSITYVDTAGSTQTLSASLYQVDAKSRPGRIAPAYGQSWPATRTQSYNAVTVTFVAGYGAASTAVPTQIIQAMRLAISTWNLNREESTLPLGSEQLLLSVWDGRYP